MRWLILLFSLAACNRAPVKEDNFKLVQCGTFSGCEATYYFLDRADCEQMRDKLSEHVEAKGSSYTIRYSCANISKGEKQ